mmetsp:Transcript_15716/g.43964  ORF Transcript_15716/g.43964 Transcript_15716/m.43964 type:complete len:415 (-) Transcript_15716:153-1397(-)
MSIPGMERGTVPVSLGTMGYHNQYIMEKRTVHNDSKYQAALSNALRTPSVPNTGESSRGSASSHGVPQTAASHKGVTSSSMPSTTNGGAATAPASSSQVMVPVSSSTALAVIDQNTTIPSSQARNQSKLFRKGFVPAEIDFDAIADSSVGGNGLPRPYGRFIAGRDGNGLSMWQRIPPVRPDSSQVPGPPPVGRAPPQARNVTQINIERNDYKNRSLRPELPVPSHFLPRKDKVTNLPHSLLMVEAEARARPFHSGLGRDYYASRFYNRESGRINLPAASFLCKRPNLPANVRVDCGTESTHSHLCSQLPVAGPEWDTAGGLDIGSAPVYHGTVIRKDGVVEELRKPPANREKLMHPAVVKYEPPRLTAPPPAAMAARPSAPLERQPLPLPESQKHHQKPVEHEQGQGSTFITQ